MHQDRRLVWDLPTRLFHWLFVLNICCSYATAKAGFTWMPWHMRLGYFMIGLLVFRVVWGFVGPKHARFSSFLAGPRHILRYLKGSAHSIGHNPLGGLMVIVMLLLVALQVTTGLFSTDDIAYAGPYNPAVSNDLAEKLTGIHHWNFNLILAAIGLHLCAILFYTFVRKQKLVPAMIHGHKDAKHVPAPEAIKGHQLAKALVIIVLVAGGVFWLVHAAPPPAASSY